MAAERLDVDVDVELVLAIAKGSDGVFEFGGAAMGFAERKIFVHLEVKFDEEITGLLVSGDVMDGMADALGDGANGFEEIFVVGGARLGVNDDVGGNDLADAFFDDVAEGVHLFEAGGARDGDAGVHEIAIAGAADTNAFDAQHAFRVADSAGDFALQALGSGVEECIECAYSAES